MAYNSHFYRMYANYLRELAVIKAHQKAFDVFSLLMPAHTPTNVVDLGCGLGEYGSHGYYTNYVGLDKQPELQQEERWVKLPPYEKFLVSDYTTLDFVDQLSFVSFEPTAFISLFSIEACLPLAERYALYTKMFSTFPTIQHALVSGFYYASKAGEETVSETGDITSYQTVESLESVKNDTFSEMRLTMHVPSEMFGPDVYEVWKILTRKA